MSVIVKGMEMPRDDSVMLWVLPNGIACVMDDSGQQYKAIEIPPHGRLIDADVLMDEIGIAKDCTDCKRSGIFGCKEDSAFVYACECIDDAPTIIGAEE